MVNCLIRSRSKGHLTVDDWVIPPTEVAIQTLPTSSSNASGPASPVTAKPTSAFKALQAPVAMASTASWETLGMSGTSKTEFFTSEEYATIEPLKMSLAPGTDVNRLPINPPVKDSAIPNHIVGI